jgi:acetylornithine deacetylase/succinyl-diaminopimelate desuccinylase-like protein
VTVALTEERSPATPPPTLPPVLLKAIETQAAKQWPGVPVIPTMSTGATDGIHMTAGGIPTFGLTGLFADASGNGVHGLNERIRVKSLYDGRDFLYGLVKSYSLQP